MQADSLLLRSKGSLDSSPGSSSNLRLLLGGRTQSGKIIQRHPRLIVHVLDRDGLTVLQAGVTEFPIHVALVTICDQCIDVRGISDLPPPEPIVKVASSDQLDCAIRPARALATHIR